MNHRLSLALLSCVFLRCDASAPSRPPLVLLYVVDTLRADVLGVYGREPSPSPNLDRFARDATAFERAHAASSWTKPSVPSLLTGRPPLAHGVYEGSTRDREGRITSDVLAPEEVTIAERLRERGYATGAFVKNAHLRPFLGFDQGFDVYREGIGDAEAIHRSFLEWAEAVRREAPQRPIFAWLHVLDVHGPYELPPPEAERLDDRAAALDAGRQKRLLARWKNSETPDPADVAALRRRYEACVAGWDRRFGELLVRLDRRGWLDGAVVMVTSDHGESFGERGRFGHGHDLGPELVRVPLVVRLPGGGGRRVREPVSLLDVAPTLARLAGAGPLGPRDARGLFEPKGRTPSVAEVLHGLEYRRALYAREGRLEERARFVGRVERPRSGPLPVVPGERIEAKGEWDGSKLEAERVEREPPGDDDLEVRCALSAVEGDLLRLGPLVVEAERDLAVQVRGGGTASLCDLEEGDVVEVEIDDPEARPLRASEIEARPDKAGSDTVKVEGMVTRVSEDALWVAGVEIEIEPETEWVGFERPARLAPRRLPRAWLAPARLADPASFERRIDLFDATGRPLDDPVLRRRWLEALDACLSSFGPARDAPRRALDEETVEALRGIGYVGS